MNITMALRVGEKGSMELSSLNAHHCDGVKTSADGGGNTRWLTFGDEDGSSFTMFFGSWQQAREVLAAGLQSIEEAAAREELKS